MTASRYLPPMAGPVLRAQGSVVKPVIQLGHMLAFFLRALMSVPIVVRHYRREFLRLLSTVAWGNGSIVVGGGTAGVVVVLGATTGTIVAIEGFNFLDMLGLGPATGVISSLVNTRELAPIMAALGFAMQSGCGFTAQLGSMRIAEEIDALEATAIPPIPYLVTTRLMASVIAIVPLYTACLAVSYLSCQIAVGIISTGAAGSVGGESLGPQLRYLTTLISGGAIGSYLHYFAMMLSAKDIAYSIIKSIIFVWIASTVQCYYGYYARGGPEGVGVAAGHAIRASITVVIIVNMLLTMAMWSVDAGARFGG